MCDWKSWIWPGIVTIALLTALAMWFRAGSLPGERLGEDATGGWRHERSVAWTGVSMPVGTAGRPSVAGRAEMLS